MREESPLNLAKEIGKSLALLRTSLGWKQTTLAAKAGIKPSSLSLYEAGKELPKLATLFRLLDTMDYRLGDLDKAGDFLLSLQISRLSRTPEAVSPESPSSLASYVQELAFEAGSAVLRLTEGVALLAGSRPTSEKVRATAREAGFPLPEDRARASELWETLKKYPHEVRCAFVAEIEEFQTWALSELLCHESEDAAAEDPAEALDLAHLALEVADRVRGEDAFLSRLHGYVRSHLGNARRVQGQLRAAREDFDRGEKEWKAGKGCPGAGLLSEARRLDLESSLLRAERHLPEALKRLDEALEIGEPAMKGRLLIKKSKVLEEKDELAEAIVLLKEAEPFVDAGREPRLWLCLQHNTLWCLTTAGRHEEAEELLPEVRALSRRLGKELDRVRLLWAEGRIAAGLGRIQTAIDLLSRVRGEFVSKEIWYDAALVTLELAVVFLREGKTAMVKTLAAHMKPIFESQGVHREAMAALTLFRQAAEQEKATLDLAEKLVTYLRKARHEPELKFQ